MDLKDMTLNEINQRKTNTMISCTSGSKKYNKLMNLTKIIRINRYREQIHGEQWRKEWGRSKIGVGN